jgi:ribonuclease R
LRNITEGNIVFISKNKAYLGSDLVYDTKNALNLDFIKAKWIRGKLVVDKIVKRHREEYIGIVSVKRGIASIVPIDSKIYTDFYVSSISNELNGHKVLFKIKDWSNKLPEAEIIKDLGKGGNPITELSSIILDNSISEFFADDVIESLNEIPKFDISNRRDFRNILTFTIDPDDAKDFDDALSIQCVGNFIEIGIHIADVSYYITKSSLLDVSAMERGNSTYLVDRVIPMLPEILSNDICSLVPNKDRLTYSIVFTMNDNGDIIDKWIGRTVINSNNRFTYDEVQNIIEGVNSEYSDAIITLNNIAKKIRNNRNSIDLNKKDVKFILDDNKMPIEMLIYEQMDANMLIEEYMLLANKYIAFFLRGKYGYCVNRIHDIPKEIQLDELSQICKQFGISFKYSNNMVDIRNSINDLILSVKGTSIENLLNNLIIRSFSKAKYSTEDIGHFGLGFDNYCHFTSPIRRYSDILVHRLLDGIDVDNLESICSHISNTEIKSKNAERNSVKLMQSILLSNRIGNICDGIVTGIGNGGLYVEIQDYLCDGFVPFDKRIIDIINNYTIIYRGNRICVGDSIRVIIKRVDVSKRQIELSLFL